MRHSTEDPDLLKADGEEEEEEGSEEEGSENEEGEENDMENAKKAKKSVDLSQDDLQKSLDQLESLADDTGESRKQSLLSKAQDEDLSKSEQEELFNLLGGEGDDLDTDLGEDLTKGFEENETLQQALDVSDYLQEQHTEMVKSLQGLADELVKSDNRQHEFNLVLAKALSQVGRHVESMADRLGVLEGQPARKPKSMGAGPLNKSFAGQPAAEDGLSKSQVLDAMDAMMEKSMAAGQNGIAAHGEDMAVAISKYEQFNTISQGMLQAVREHLGKGATTH
jgi:hypothetical protein